MKRYLILEDGSVFEGRGFGANQFRMGELVFNTSMTGYQEILTDPSYCDQIVMMTYPLIGNTGINPDDHESLSANLVGFVVKQACLHPNHYRQQTDLDTYLKTVGVPGIEGVDTRALTLKLRKTGVMKAVMSDDASQIENLIQKLSAPMPTDQVARVSTSKPYRLPGPGKRVVIMDFGAKLNIVAELAKRQLDLIVVPYNTLASTILSYRPAGLMLTNGPGNPEDVQVAIETIRELMDKLPTFGICLGHQLIALACGAKTYKLRFGHRGANHPVKELATGKVDITSQNHGYAVDVDSLKKTDLVLTHVALNDGSCEGLRHESLPVFSVQYHPEACAGPHDANHLFDQFVASLKEEHHA